MKGHIAIVTARFYPVACGVGDYARELGHELVKMGWKVTILTRNQGCPEQLDGMTVRQPVSQWNALALPRLKRELDSLKPDIVHLEYEPFGFRQSFAVPWFFTYGHRPVIVTLHEVWHAKKIHRLRDKYLYGHVDRLIAVDNGVLSRLVRIEPRAAAHVTKLGVGSTLRFKPEKSWADIHPEGQSGELLRIGYFGFFNKTKRNEALLEAFALFQKQYGGSAHLDLVGRFTPKTDSYHRELLERAKSLEIADKVTFTGQLDAPEATRTLAQCDFAVLPYVDGVSTRRSSFQACMTLGVPVITTKAPQEEPDIKNGQTALIIDDVSPTGLASPMLKLASDPQLRWRLHSGAIEYIQNFTWTKIAREHDRLYSELLTTKARTPNFYGRSGLRNI